MKHFGAGRRRRESDESKHGVAGNVESERIEEMEAHLSPMDSLLVDPEEAVSGLTVNGLTL